MLRKEDKSEVENDSVVIRPISTIDKCARNLIDDDVKEFFCLPDDSEDNTNYFDTLQNRSKRLMDYMENGPEKFMKLGTRIVVDWVRVQPEKESVDDTPITFVLLLRDKDESTTNQNEP